MTILTGQKKEPRPAGDDGRWISAARGVAEELAVDALERDRANEPPFREVGTLREAGLLRLLIPPDRGGHGAGWRTAYAVTREVARGDGSIGQLIGYHYLLSYNPRFFGGPEIVARLDREAAAGDWFWGGAFNPRDPDLTLRREAGGFRLDGRKSFCTGARVADRLFVGAARSDTGEPLVLFVDPRADGVSRNDDWDNLGQRLSASGSVDFGDVFVPDSDVVGSVGTEDEPLSPFGTMVTPAIQLVFVHFYLGIAEGALAKARDYTRGVSRPWILSGADSAARDPYTVFTYGELSTQLLAAGALADQAVDALEEALARGQDLTGRERGEAATLIAAAKVASTQAAMEVTSRIFELTGARSTASKVGLDLYWRNARTHTLHDPVAYKLREVGDFYLNDEIPPFTLYT